MPEWDGLLPSVSCGERPIIDNVRTPVAYSKYSARSELAGLAVKVTDTCSRIKLRLQLAVHSRVTVGICLVEYIRVQTSMSVCLHFCTQNAVYQHFIYLYDIAAGPHKE